MNLVHESFGSSRELKTFHRVATIPITSTRSTQRPSGTLLFNRLPMTIWQKNDKTADNRMIGKKIVKWQKFKSALCNLTKNLLLLNFVSMHFWTEISNQCKSQIHAWILLKKKNLLHQILFYFLQVKSFPPWMASFN